PPGLRLVDTRSRRARPVARADRGLRFRSHDRGAVRTRHERGDTSSAMSVRAFVAFVLALAAGFSSEGADASDRMGPSPQPPSARVRILSPADGAFVVGPTRLRAEVEPSDATSSVIFFVDGLKVCTVAAPPFECEWDAGSVITEHLVRLVVNLAAGGRVVRTTRTAAAEFAET